MTQTIDFLDGLQIVEVSAFVSAPLAGTVLASLGADVIKVDPIDKPIDADRWPIDDEGRSMYWAGLNCGKRSLALDLSTSTGRNLLLEVIAETSGIVLTNHPTAPYLAFEKLAARRPDVILCRVLGHPNGVPAVDYTVNAATGFPFLVGPESTTDPINNPLPVWDIATGLHLAVAILAAHTKRAATGQGALISVSLFEVALSIAGRLGFLAELDTVGSSRQRIGNHIYGAFGRDFATLDSRRVMIVAITSGQFQRLVNALDLHTEVSRLEDSLGHTIASHGDLFDARESLASIVEDRISRLSLDETLRLLTEHRVIHAPFQTFEEAMSHEGLWSSKPFLNRLFRSDGSTVLQGPDPYSGSGDSEKKPRIPTHGEHSHLILAEILGLSPQIMNDLVEQHVIPPDGKSNV